MVVKTTLKCLPVGEKKSLPVKFNMVWSPVESGGDDHLEAGERECW